MYWNDYLARCEEAGHPRDEAPSLSTVQTYKPD